MQFVEQARNRGSAPARDGGRDEMSSHEAATLLGGLTATRIGQLVREGRLEGRVVRGRLLVQRGLVEALRAQRAAA